jgi:electron transfer flavoprotein alpha subunit
MALVPIRQGRLAAGGEEVVAEARGRAVLAGEGTREAALALPSAGRLTLVELGPFAPAAWSSALASLLEPDRHEDLVLVPASPDGRDLAPCLAHEVGWPLVTGAVLAQPGRILARRYGGLVLAEYRPEGPAIVTLEPGSRGLDGSSTQPRPLDKQELEIQNLSVNLSLRSDPQSLGVARVDATSLDLSEAERIVAGGGGLGGAEAMKLLARVAQALGGAVGATRVATDAGWADHRAQIGTTGVCIDPRLYLAFGISGAAQHVAGLGLPDHVVAVNTDPSCPMMALADLAVVADAPALLAELATLLGVPLG